MENKKITPVVEKHYKLILWMLPKMANFPKDQRFLLADRIEKILLDVLEMLIEAVYSKHKREILIKINLKLDVLRFMMRIAKDMRCYFIIKVSIFRLFLTRNIKINNNLLLLKFLNANIIRGIFFRNETKQLRLVLSHLVIVACLFLTIFPVAGFSFIPASAAAEAVTYESALVWRADGAGDYTLPTLAEKETTTSTPAIATKGVVKTVTLTWVSEGDVQLSVSADDGLHYTPIVNGVPLTAGFPTGTTLKWKAVVGAGSKLTEVKISYTDSSGVAGDFGAPELSGFKYRKSFKLSGSSVANLFNYQARIILGESGAAKGADVSCDGHILADFNDVRFVLTDGETPLPFTLEKISGAKPNRAAEFFVKVPQIPASGLLLYVYYGNPVAANLSDPDKTFDFYEDFTTGADALDKDKWVTHISPGGSSALSKNGLLLDAASVMTKDFQFKGGIIEVAAAARTGFETRIIIRDASPDVESDAGQVAYSSAYKDAEHCIAVGKIVKANVANPSVKDTLYNYRVSVDADNNIAFDRYSDGFAEKQATITYQDVGGLASGYLGLKTAGLGLGASQTLFSWIRVRKNADVEPLVDPKALGQEEAVELPLFVNTTVAPNGDLVLLNPKADGSYATRPATSEYDIRIITPSWKGTGASVDVSVDNGQSYKKDCTNGTYYYAGRGDFTKGKNIQSRITFKGTDESSLPNLEFITVQYALGSIVVLSPNGGEVLGAGSQDNIKWTAWDYEASYPMKLEYSLDAGKTYQVIDGQASNTGSYVWQVPNIQTSKALVRISDSFDPQTFYVSDKSFSIGAIVNPSVSSGGMGQAAETEGQTAGVGESGTVPDDQNITKNKKQADSVEKRPGASLYEMAVKIGTDPTANNNSYRDGDIVMVRPAGYVWGTRERKEFQIIRIYLTQREAQNLMSSQRGADGKMILRRIYKIDRTKQNLAGGSSEATLEAVEEKK